MKVYDVQTETLVKEVDPNLNASAVQWQAPVRVDGLDPSKEYYLTVTSTDGKEVLVDGYNAFPYQAPQGGTSPMALNATSTASGGESAKGTTERPLRPKQEQQQKGSGYKHKGTKHKH